MECKYCGERDESKLILSSRLVNGRAETIDICFRCYWREKFEAEAKGENMVRGEDGKSILQEREQISEFEPAGSINPIGLRERI